MKEKSKTITFRLDAKMDFAIQILSRKQHRTVSQIVKLAVLRALDDSTHGLYDDSGNSIMDEVWDDNPIQRLLNIQGLYPDLLSQDEADFLEALGDED